MSLPCSLMPNLRPYLKRFLTLQARPAQVAVLDLLAPVVQQVSTFQVCVSLLSVTYSSCRSLIRLVSGLQACLARAAVQAQQVGSVNMHTMNIGIRAAYVVGSLAACTLPTCTFHLA